MCSLQPHHPEIGYVCLARLQWSRCECTATYPLPCSHVLINHPLDLAEACDEDYSCQSLKAFFVNAIWGYPVNLGLAASVPILLSWKWIRVCHCCHLFATPTVSFSVEGSMMSSCAFPMLNPQFRVPGLENWWASLSPCSLWREPSQGLIEFLGFQGPWGNFLWNSKWFLFLELISPAFPSSLGETSSLWTSCYEAQIS